MSVRLVYLQYVLSLRPSVYVYAYVPVVFLTTYLHFSVHMCSPNRPNVYVCVHPFVHVLLLTCSIFRLRHTLRVRPDPEELSRTQQGSLRDPGTGGVAEGWRSSTIIHLVIFDSYCLHHGFKACED